MKRRRLRTYASCARDGGASGIGKSETRCSRVAPSKGARVCVTLPEKPGAQVSSPDAVCRVMRSAQDLDREAFYTLYLNAQNKIAGVEQVAIGTLTHVEVHPREAMKGALAANAAAIIVAHNHPSGDPSPSRDDRALTKRLVQAGDLLGIPVLDHVVIGRDKCVSVRETDPGLFSVTEFDGNYKAKK